MSGELDYRYDPGTHPFVSHATAYNGNNALFLAAMANLAYEREATVRSQAGAWGFERFDFFEAGGSEAFIVGDDQKIVVAFRGTEPEKLVDWLTDVNIVLVDGPGGRVHNGFSHGVKRVWRDLRQRITDFQDNAERPQSLWFTGHSLGAALATIAVALLRFEEDKPVYGLYTFGQPRTGDQGFANFTNMDTMAGTYRFVNNNDIVTRVPPRALDYRHVGKMIYFTSGGRAETDIGFWMQFLDTGSGAASTTWASSAQTASKITTWTPTSAWCDGTSEPNSDGPDAAQIMRHSSQVIGKLTCAHYPIFISRS
jgi:triacylglycerol lipase